MPDLKTTYLGLELDCPIVVSSNPLCEEMENIRRMEEAGAGAVVLHSLFEEQITTEGEVLDYFINHVGESYAEALSYFPNMEAYNHGPEGYLDHVRRAKEAVGIPIIASLNGVSTGGWIRYARLIEEAGADALELNLYYLPTHPSQTGAQVEDMYQTLVRDVVRSVDIPVAVKITPYFSALANMAHRLEESGARGLVLFNRFYQPDIDLEGLKVTPRLHLSRPEELLERLRWTAILSPHLNVDLAVTGGVHSAEDVLKAMMVGAKAAYMASAMLLHGIDHIARVRSDLLTWMEEHEYESICQMQGSMSHKKVAEPTAYERANYMNVLQSFRIS